jgi:hypothetical protein
VAVQDRDPVATGMSLDEAENFVTFLRMSAHVRRTHCLPETVRSRGAPVA